MVISEQTIVVIIVVVVVMVIDLLFWLLKVLTLHTRARERRCCRGGISCNRENWVFLAAVEVAVVMVVVLGDRG